MTVSPPGSSWWRNNSFNKSALMVPVPYLRGAYEIQILKTQRLCIEHCSLQSLFHFTDSPHQVSDHAQHE
jgi:hypothetical protein